MRTFHEVQIIDQLGHYIRRAREERVLAARATSLEGEEAHRQLAHQYETLISNLNAASLSEKARRDADQPKFPFPFSNGGMRTGFAHPMASGLRPAGLPSSQH